MQPTSKQASHCVIREAAADDARSIENLYRELVSDPNIRVLPEHLNAIADLPHSFLLAADSEGAVCATALLTICPDAMYGAQPFGVVENVIVTQAMRGRGIGRLLLTHVERLATAHHCTKLMLLSGNTRPEAHAFFRRCRFSGDTKHAFVKYRKEFAA
jgi:N-acetylglutamate synthase-like GNAT family acetyltransferase